MIKAVIYDLDGTLLDTLSTIAGYCNDTMRHFGLREFELDEYRYFVGDGARVLIKRLLERNGVPESEYFERAYEYYNDIYNATPLEGTTPYDGICALVAALGERGLKQAVLSNKPDIAVKSNVEHFFSGSFERICGARDGVPLKPDPSMLKVLFDELGVDASECVYVGDTDVDMKTGRAAGVFTVGVLWGFRTEDELRRAGADLLAKEPHDILSAIERSNGGI